MKTSKGYHVVDGETDVCACVSVKRQLVDSNKLARVSFGVNVLNANNWQMVTRTDYGKLQ